MKPRPAARSISPSIVSRIFLHDLLWKHDRVGLLERLDGFLATADARGIGSLLVLFDGVWDPHSRWGVQLEPRPGVHDSRWVQSPGAAILGGPSRHDELAGERMLHARKTTLPCDP